MEEDIKILEEKINKDYKDMIAVINSTSLPLFVEDTIEDMHILIEHLIARNKELEKQSKFINEVKALGTDEVLQVVLNRSQYLFLFETSINSVPKSKVREKLLKPIQEEGEKAYKSFMSKKKEENFEIDGALLQELGCIEGMIIELLED